MKNNIPQTMKAVVLTADGANPVVKEIPTPTPGPGEVLVKMHASPINPSDLAFLAGGYGIQKAFPAVPGFEGSGQVVKAGKGLLPRMWMGKSVACAASPTHNGCWAEYMVTKAGMCVPVSNKISLDKASMMFVNPMTALAFIDVYNKLPNPSKKVRGIINTAGASALGQMLIRLGKKQGIPIISVVRRQEQVDLLKEKGADYVLNSSDVDFSEKLKQLAQQLNASVIFDAVGGEMIQQLLNAAPKGSSLFIYGRLSDEACEISPGELIFTGNKIQGFWLTEWLRSKNMFQMLRITKSLKSMLNHELGTEVYKTFKADSVNEAIETYKSNMSKGKVLLKFAG